MTKPSEITYRTHTGYRKHLPTGWVNFPEATIHGDGYDIKFYRLSEVTCDRNNDALNGYRNVWTKFRASLIVNGTEINNIVIKTVEDADKLFTIFGKAKTTVDESEGTITALEKVDVGFDALRNFI